ncbi:MAG: response regulator transcription factor [Cytophagales bacterium]|nr:response regulator transcription factor [Cytophagales bacterium]
MIKLLLADDHQIVLDGLSSLLSKERDMKIIDEVPDGELVLKVLATKQVDIVILDIEMPELDGIETTKAIKETYKTVKVLILSMYNDEEFIKQIIQIGASGYILKNRGKEELVDAIRKIAEGGQFFGEAVTNVLIEGLRKPKNLQEKEEVILTRREKEVLGLISHGLTTPQIAEKLFIAHSTVETHRRNLIDKTNSSNTKALIRYAYKNGLVD